MFHSKSKEGEKKNSLLESDWRQTACLVVVYPTVVCRYKVRKGNKVLERERERMVRVPVRARFKNSFILSFSFFLFLINILLVEVIHAHL